MSFFEKVILITGASSGCGEGVAIHFAKLGANVVISGRNAQKLHSVANKCDQLAIGTVLEVTTDLQNDEEVKNLVRKTVDTFGKIDILINCAGILESTSIEDTHFLETFDAMMSTNLRSVVLLTALVVPYLELTKGSIVNVSSLASHSPRKNWCGYAMSKAGVDMLTKSLAFELGGKHIRVNSINPSIVLTPMSKTVGGVAVDEETLKMYCELNYPLGRIGYVDDIVYAIEFLVSYNSSFITGINMLVDGGAYLTQRSRL